MLVMCFFSQFQMEEEEDPNLGLDNPTPAMLALKRKSMAVAGKRLTAAATPVAQKKKKKASPIQKAPSPVKKASPVKAKKIATLPPRAGFPGKITSLK